MSLINNMLKNLEKREQHSYTIPYIAIKNSQHRINKKNYYKKIALSFIISFLFVISITLFFSEKPLSVAHMLKEKTSISHEFIPPISSDANWLDPVLITGITLQVKENITEISFLLNHASLYRLINNGMQNQLTLIFDHSQLQSELPPVKFLNTAIQHISTQKINGDTVFNLLLNPDAVIKYANLNNEEKNPELVIAIEYQSREVPVKNNQPSDTIKTQAMQSLLLQQYQTALTAIEEGNYAKATENLSSLIKINPAYKDARVSLAALLINKNMYTKAERLIDEGLNINPDYIPLIELKARILNIKGSTLQALTLLQNFSPSINENPDYYSLTAALYERNNDDLLAMRLYNRLLSIDPQNGSWWFGLGVSMEKLGRGKEAIDAYTRASAEGHLSLESITYLKTHLKALQEANNEKG